MPWWLVVLAVLVLLLAGLGTLVLLAWQVWRKLKLLGREVRVGGQLFGQVGDELERLSTTAEASRDAGASGRRPGAGGRSFTGE